MWDEKQFFDDFVRESNQIQPSAEFVNKMRTLSEKSLKTDLKKKSTNLKVITGVLAAAAVVGILFIVGEGPGKRELILLDDTMYAEKEEAHSVTEGNVYDIFDDKKLLLENALTEGTVTVKDAQGEEVTAEEREILLEQIVNAEETELSVEDLEQMEATVYDVEGKMQVRISIMGDKYLVIQDTVYQIKND